MGSRLTLLPLLELLGELVDAVVRREVGDERDALALVALLVKLVGRLLERLLVARRNVDARGAGLEVAVGDLWAGSRVRSVSLARGEEGGETHSPADALSAAGHDDDLALDREKLRHDL